MALENDLLNSLFQAFAGEVKGGISAGSNLARTQAKVVADATRQLADLRTTGSFKDDDVGFQEALDHLATLAKNFLLALFNLTLATLQKAFDAVMDIIWDAFKSVSAPLAGIVKPLLP